MQTKAYHTDAASPTTNGATSKNGGTTIVDSVRGRASQVFNLVGAAIAPVPDGVSDGLTAAEAAAPGDVGKKEDLLRWLGGQIKDGFLRQEPLDDRKFLMEDLIVRLQTSSPDSSLSSSVTDAFVRVLWDDLPHPPMSFLGTQTPSKSSVGVLPPAWDGTYRTAGGAGNNRADQLLGAAGQPYARSVPPMHPLPHNLPDPTVVFDALLKRDKFVPHPSGISSLLFAFATVIIHSCFQTSREDPNINEASSYLDLSPLYGNNKAEMDKVRTGQQGLLWPDVVGSSRLFLMPPAVIALLVIFSRNHNYIATKLFQINEWGKFKPVGELDPDGIKKQDEVLFQTARLVNCGYFTNVIFQDYIRVILNQNLTAQTWALNPTGAIHDLAHGTLPRGTGNAVSVEFNVLYRWHSAISQADEKWIGDLFRKYLEKDKPIESMTQQDFVKVLKTLTDAQGTDPRAWTMMGWKRQASGFFADADLAKILTGATNEVAGAFKARGSPAVMRVIDVLGIAAARNDWNTCTLNEFRKFLNLTTFKTFREWNNDPEIAKAAEMLYGHPDNLELYPGLLAEQAKPSRPGSGLAPGYTISRAILSDATALVRGDRFLTTGLNASSLTAWGLEDLVPDLGGGSFGGVVGKLLMRNLPSCYTFNSIYAMFPFSTPATTAKILAGLGLTDKYDFNLPKMVGPWHAVNTNQGVLDVLRDHKHFGVVYGASIEQLCKSRYGFFIAFDNVDKHRSDRDLMDKTLFPYGWEKDLADFYNRTTADLIRKNSWSYDNNKTLNVDVVRDVTNLASVYWVSHQFGMPLKTTENPRGLFTPQELYLILSAFFAYVFLNFDPVPGFKLRDVANKQGPIISGLIEIRLAQATGVPVIIENLARRVQDLFLGQDVDGPIMNKEARAFYNRLLASERPLDQLNDSVHCIMTASTSNQGDVAAQVINFYLDPVNKKHYDAIVKLAKLSTPAADAKLLGYVLEAMRLDPQVAGIPRVVKEATKIKDGSNSIHLAKGDMVFASVKRGSRDPLVFPNPDEVNPERPVSSYTVFGAGMHNCLGSKLVNISMPAMIRQVFSLKNVRRAAGSAGTLYRFNQDIVGTPNPIYLSAQGTFTPFPVSLSIVYDG